MSACKLGTVPVNRLTREQCDKMIQICKRVSQHRYNAGFIREYYRHISLENRIQQYRDNLTTRGL